MSCQVCADKGIVKLNWSDAPEDYGVCLCAVGRTMRETRNAGKRTDYALWQVWATREGIDPDRVLLLEDILTDEEMRECGFVRQVVTSDPMAALSSIGKRKGKL
jgi:hypothetical protein